MRKLTEVKLEMGAHTYRLNVLSMYILRSLLDGPKNGYDLLKELRQLSENRWTPPKSTIYPLLKKMVEEGLLEVDEHGFYRLTERGYQVLESLKRNPQIVDELMKNIDVIKRILEKIKEIDASSEPY